MLIVLHLVHLGRASVGKKPQIAIELDRLGSHWAAPQRVILIDRRQHAKFDVFDQAPQLFDVGLPFIVMTHCLPSPLCCLRGTRRSLMGGALSYRHMC